MYIKQIIYKCTTFIMRASVRVLFLELLALARRTYMNISSSRSVERLHRFTLEIRLNDSYTHLERGITVRQESQSTVGKKIPHDDCYQLNVCVRVCLSDVRM